MFIYACSVNYRTSPFTILLQATSMISLLNSRINSLKKRTQLKSNSRRRDHLQPFVKPALYYNHRQQIAQRCSTPNRLETAHLITANSLSLSPAPVQKHSHRRIKQLMLRRRYSEKTRDCAIRQGTRDLTSSDTPSGQTPACTLYHPAPNNSCQSACSYSNTTNSASQYWFHFAINRLVRIRTPPRRYDVRTVCPHARTPEISQHTSF